MVEWDDKGGWRYYAHDMSTYPYACGDTEVLGPGIFASADGSVISWKGTNYTVQMEPRWGSLSARESREALRLLRLLADSRAISRQAALNVMPDVVEFVRRLDGHGGG